MPGVEAVGLGRPVDHATDRTREAKRIESVLLPLLLVVEVKREFDDGPYCDVQPRRQAT